MDWIGFVFMLIFLISCMGLLLVIAWSIICALIKHKDDD